MKPKDVERIVSDCNRAHHNAIELMRKALLSAPNPSVSKEELLAAAFTYHFVSAELVRQIMAMLESGFAGDRKN